MNPDPLSTRAQTREPIITPCIRVCVMDPASGNCQGCHRTLEEIMAWTAYTHAQRLTIIAQLDLRKPAK